MTKLFTAVPCNIAVVDTTRHFHNVNKECRVTFIKNHQPIGSSDIITSGSFMNVNVANAMADLCFNLKACQSDLDLGIVDPYECYRDDLTRCFTRWLDTIHTNDDIRWWFSIMIINYVLANGTIGNVKTLREIEVDLTERTITAYWTPMPSVRQS